MQQLAFTQATLQVHSPLTRLGRATSSDDPVDVLGRELRVLVGRPL